METKKIYQTADSRSVLPDEAKGKPEQTPKAYTLPKAPAGAAQPVAVIPPAPVVPPVAVEKTYAVLTLYSKSGKAVPFQYRWSNGPNKLTDALVPANGDLCLFVEVAAGQAMPRITIVTDSTDEFNGKKKVSRANPIATDGWRVGVQLP